MVEIKGEEIGKKGRQYRGLMEVAVEPGARDRPILRISDFSGRLGDVPLIADFYKNKKPFDLSRETPDLLRKIILDQLERNQVFELEEKRKEFKDRVTVDSLRELRGKGEGLCAFEYKHAKTWRDRKGMLQKKEIPGLVAVNAQKIKDKPSLFDVKVFGPLKQFDVGRGNLSPDFHEASDFLKGTLNDRAGHRYITRVREAAPEEEIGPPRAVIEEKPKEEEKKETTEELIAKMLDSIHSFEKERRAAKRRYDSMRRTEDLLTMKTKRDAIELGKNVIIRRFAADKNVDPDLIEVRIDEIERGGYKVSLGQLDEDLNYKELLKVEK